MSKRLSAGAALAVAALAASGAQARPVDMPLALPSWPDVRSTATWSAEVRSEHTLRLPNSVCRGFLPSDYEAWSVRHGNRVGDDRLVIDRPQRSITSHYRGPVRVFVWCEEG